METNIIRSKIKKSVKNWAKAEKGREGRLRAKPEVVLRFLPTSRRYPRVTTRISLYHKAKGKNPVRINVQTTNSFGELIVALETILNEWRQLSGYR